MRLDLKIVGKRHCERHVSGKKSKGVTGSHLYFERESSIIHDGKTCRNEGKHDWMNSFQILLKKNFF